MELARLMVCQFASHPEQNYPTAALLHLRSDLRARSFSGWGGIEYDRVRCLMALDRGHGPDHLVIHASQSRRIVAILSGAFHCKR
jgi:hypothetical protein